MDNRIPLIINYDLEGYRGCGLTEFPLSFRVIDGKVIGSYSNDGAGYALFTEKVDLEGNVGVTIIDDIGTLEDA